MKRLRPITTESTGLRRGPREDMGATDEAQVEKNGKRSEVAVDALGKRAKP